ncbi:hypothetical protein [Pedococcus sp. 5OH_020]|uniref:hypothetical protein n=1 Tax=Pedococcus sp. 5OH_020 TaxID=2989814 RepID=UPI0022E9F76B|nr:hypothetical protein [Pedococcus sp. 5OH_020]
MVLIGLLMILVALGAGVLLFLGTQPISTAVDLEVGGQHVSMTPLALLIAGALAMLLLVLGLAAIRGSLRRRRRPHREAKEAQRRAELEENIRADERARAEENHQSAMADRDRVREEEFRTKLEERERVRTQELDAQRRHDEERIRADERAKAQQELRGAALPGATSSGVGPAADVRGAGQSQAGEPVEGSEEHLDPVAQQSGDAVNVPGERLDEGSESRAEHGLDAQAKDDHAHDPAHDRAEERLDDGTTDAADDPADESTNDRALDPGNDRVDHDEPRTGLRTVADKIMGRGPSGDSGRS